jgi:hypothetical protein
VHVHQADAARRVRRHHVERARLAQCPDVVDDVGAEVERLAHDFGLVGVDGDRHAQRTASRTTGSTRAALRRG